MREADRAINSQCIFCDNVQNPNTVSIAILWEIQRPKKIYTYVAGYKDIGRQQKNQCLLLCSSRTPQYLCFNNSCHGLALVIICCINQRKTRSSCTNKHIIAIVIYRINPPPFVTQLHKSCQVGSDHSSVLLSILSHCG